MKRLLEIIISICAGILLLLLYVKLGANKVMTDIYSTRGLAVAAGGLFIAGSFYIKKYLKEKRSKNRNP